MADPEGEILTLDEVAAYLKAGKRTVYRLAAAKKIPALKSAGHGDFRVQTSTAGSNSSRWKGWTRGGMERHEDATQDHH